MQMHNTHGLNQIFVQENQICERNKNIAFSLHFVYMDREQQEIADDLKIARIKMNKFTSF